ncbi:hypothetical protein OSB04_029976 [Centaurea solstitialis]|uniref:Uncharacterized protein n=1 Tax=Centaurea solstitialis TaxID=347529 RepID=A0AA38SE89_9ASTR|nr:hypothetical protein OSB04_029976 [Centaurea solstitialis]
MHLTAARLGFRCRILGMAGDRRPLEVNLAESSHKFITCIRKYILFYMKLLEETRDISTLERAYVSTRADKRIFAICLRSSAQKSLKAAYLDTLEMNKMKKLLLWAYALLHGHCVKNVSVIIKYCEETSLNDEPQQESRSSHLERLRSRKPDKEEPELQVVVKDTSASCRCSEVTTNAQNNESVDVAKSVYETSKNYGAYHIGHLLLEEIACRGIPLQDLFEKFLELEQLTRNSGESRIPECSIFLAELSYDFGISIIRAIDIH